MNRNWVTLSALLLIMWGAVPTFVAGQAPEQPPVERNVPPNPDARIEAEVNVDGRVQAEVDEELFQRQRRWGRPVFRLGQNYTLAADDEVAEVVVVSGDATIEGHVYRDLVVVLGNVRLASTAVVEGDFVVVGGSAIIAEGAQVGNDLVVVGGSFDAAPGFNPDGEQIVIGPRALGRELEGIIPWVTRGLLWGRPIVPDVAWVWGVVGLFFLVYLTLIVVFDRPVRVCADTLAAKPLTAFLVGLLVLLLAGPVFLLLTVSVVGIVVVPFAICALLLAWILGKVGVARWIGMSVMPESRNDSGASPRTHGMRSFTIGFLGTVCGLHDPGAGPGGMGVSRRARPWRGRGCLHRRLPHRESRSTSTSPADRAATGDIHACTSANGTAVSVVSGSCLRGKPRGRQPFRRTCHSRADVHAGVDPRRVSTRAIPRPASGIHSRRPARRDYCGAAVS